MGDFLQGVLGLPERPYFGNGIADWLGAALLAGAVWSLLSLVKRVVASRLGRRLTPAHPAPLRLLAHLAATTRQILFAGLALYAAQTQLELPERIHAAVATGLLLLLLLQAGLWAGQAVRFYLEGKERERGPDQAIAGSLDIINFVALILIWSLVGLVALENLGVNITALLAGLGVGGVAVALALQNILGDLFASLSIALDKPFVIGDTLTIDTFTGTVQHIGIKTTRLRSETGEQIILSNADILKSRVRNFGRADEQRSLATVRIAYATPIEKLEAIPALLEGIVRAQANARFERCHLRTLGDSALLFELSYFVRRPAANSLYDLQHAVNLRILDEFRRLGVDFAYPTQAVVLRS